MVNLVFVLIVSVVSRSRAEVRQCLAIEVDEVLELLTAHEAIVAGIQQVHELLDDLVPPFLRDVLVRFVEQAVRPQELLRVPVPVGIVVVQREEGGGVEVGYVVLLCIPR